MTTIVLWINDDADNLENKEYIKEWNQTVQYFLNYLKILKQQ